MSREQASIELSAHEQQVLWNTAQSESSPPRERLRAQIVLRAAERATNTQIAAETGASVPTVALWRKRFLDQRLDGLADAPRGGRPRKVDERAIGALLAKAAEPPPDGESSWSVRRLAAATGLSATTVQRIRSELRSASPRTRTASRFERDGSARLVEDWRGSPRLRAAQARRELIHRSAAAVIAERGFGGTTMALVAREAGVSTGMLNHYFANRSDMLTRTLESVSDWMLSRVRREVGHAKPGLERFDALMRAWLPNDPETLRAWRVWLAAYGETVRDERLRETIESRLQPWHTLIGDVLSGFAGDRARAVPLSWQLNALVNGLIIQALAAKPPMTFEEVRRAVLEFVTLELACDSVSQLDSAASVPQSDAAASGDPDVERAAQA